MTEQIEARVVDVGPVVTGAADFDLERPVCISPAATSVYGVCIICGKPIWFMNFVRLMPAVQALLADRVAALPEKRGGPQPGTAWVAA